MSQIQQAKKTKNPVTMVMQIANAHAFSIGFVGIQLTHGYVAALVLSSICVIVGMIVSLQTRFNGNMWMAVACGLPLGAVVAFVFDSMTMFGLKMVRESKRWKKAFSFVLIGIGIALSTMAGDQMWDLVYKDWHSWVLAASVSCVIIMVEVWHVEHEAAVKHASKQSDAVQTALATEVEVVVDKMLRSFTHEQLQSPEMAERLRLQSRKSVDDMVAAKFASRLNSFAGNSVRVIEEKPEPKQLPAPAPAPTPDRTDARGRYSECRDELARLRLQRTPRMSMQDLADHFGVGSKSTISEWIDRLEGEQEAEQTTPNEPNEANNAEQSAPNEPNTSEQPAPAPTPIGDKLNKTVDALRRDPAITDDQLAQLLDLKRPASARFWRLKAQEVLQEKAV